MSHLATFFAAIATSASLVIASAAAQAQPADAPPEKPQVLLIPLSGTIEGALADAPERLTLATSQAIAALGYDAVAAKIGKADITAITGCPAESDDCFREVASTIEVDYIVFGSVASSDDGVRVSITMITREGEVTRRTIDASGASSEAAARGFDPKVRAFLRGEPPPADRPPLDPTVPEPAPVLGPAPPRFALARVEKYSWGIAGGGLAVMGVGTILLIMADGKQDQVNDAPVDTLADLEHIADLESSGKSLTSWGNGMLIVGGLATVAGVALIVKQGMARPATERPAPPPTTVTLAPTARGDGFAVTLLGSF